MKTKKIGKAWYYEGYTSEDGRFTFKTIQNTIIDGRVYSLPASRCGFELYDGDEKIGFYKTLKAAKAVAEARQ